MSGVKMLEAQCPKCKQQMALKVAIQDEPPKVRAKIEPEEKIWSYKITSEDMKIFIQEKARMFVPGAKVEVAPRYCEKKPDKKNTYEPHRSYASLRIGMSHEVIEKTDDNGWYNNIGIDNSSVKVEKSILKELINKYSYDIKMINRWLSSYKTLEDLEESLGITEAYINDLKSFATPKRIKPSNGGNPWIIFSAAAENIITDMLTEATKDGKVPGVIKIMDVVPISKDIVEFTVYLYPEKTTYSENPAVRKILMGSDKKK